MSDVILEMHNITKTFPGVKALDNVSFSVSQGEIHALVGENGAGKSTLMNVLSGVHPYGSYSGEIYFQGKECRLRLFLFFPLPKTCSSVTSAPKTV
jgi:putative multiple sugar transport system ATP-binding protein